jgi:hypothetical protein
MAGVDFDEALHDELIHNAICPHVGKFDYSQDFPLDDALKFFYANDQFSWLDCRALFC